ncbi:uncharacterized protein F5891DRAFT_988896 [Suillus fuscotomentosus]|uniref:Uncharacterized protein n=1 Tax=Suillus fuscotomentosus TaxID=1912939 RepID=A0AAD4DQN2_9AGAM|nr:uncharacterized protein F5891DRAFT_988896 [Suillus fuscotomentosus]KAG1886412.1 hypothetical protein F5891DRAFT_988896 [Suillus fuscotomentosus]
MGKLQISHAYNFLVLQGWVIIVEVRHTAHQVPSKAKLGLNGVPRWPLAIAFASSSQLNLKYGLCLDESGQAYPVAYASTFNCSQSAVLVKQKRCLVPFLLLIITVASKLFPFCVESATSSYILTLPAEWRFYQSESPFFHLSYVSIVTIVVSNYGFFSTTFTQQTCQKYYLVAPIFKGVRTFNIARRDRRIGIALLLLYLFSISAEWFVDLFHRTQQKAAVLDLGKVLSTWFFYFPVMLYDIVMVTVSTMYLLRYNPLSSRVERLIRVVERIEPHLLSYDQSRDSALLYPLASIISRQEMTQPNAQHIEKVIVARQSTLNMQRSVMSGLRSQFESKNYSRGSRSLRSPINTEFRPTSPRNPNDMELNIRVPVERPVAVDESRNSSSRGPPVVE